MILAVYGVASVVRDIDYRHSLSIKEHIRLG